MKKTLTCALCAILAACGGTVTKERIVRVDRPVVQACAGERPAPVVPLKDKTPDWDSLDVRQKAALVAKQGLERQAYGEQLDAATAGCP